MAKRKRSEDMSGSTFADLYDIQKELGRQSTKPQGRPRKKIQRNPTTIYLTKEENTILRRLHLMMGEHLSVNRSEIVGIAIETLLAILNDYDPDNEALAGSRTPEEVKQRIEAMFE